MGLIPPIGFPIDQAGCGLLLTVAWEPQSSYHQQIHSGWGMLGSLGPEALHGGWGGNGVCLNYAVINVGMTSHVARHIY